MYHRTKFSRMRLRRWRPRGPLSFGMGQNIRRGSYRQSQPRYRQPRGRGLGGIFWKAAAPEDRDARITWNSSLVLSAQATNGCANQGERTRAHSTQGHTLLGSTYLLAPGYSANATPGQLAPPSGVWANPRSIRCPSSSTLSSLPTS